MIGCITTPIPWMEHEERKTVCGILVTARNSENCC